MGRTVNSPHPTNRVARGHVNKHGTLKRCVVAFDDETFDTIAAMARKRGCSFANVVRELVEFGMEDSP